MLSEPSPQKTRRPQRLRVKRPLLTVDLILSWADAHFERAGEWPGKESGTIHETLNETWCAINLTTAASLTVTNPSEPCGPRPGNARSVTNDL
jgi:hypothetical protein